MTIKTMGGMRRGMVLPGLQRVPPASCSNIALHSRKKLKFIRACVTLSLGEPAINEDRRHFLPSRACGKNTRLFRGILSKLHSNERATVKHRIRVPFKSEIILREYVSTDLHGFFKGDVDCELSSCIETMKRFIWTKLQVGRRYIFSVA